MSARLEAVIVEFRSAHQTIKCVGALLREGVAAIRIVDNSDDGGATSSLLRQNLPHDAPVEIIDAGGNTGFSRGVNIGMEGCVGDLVLLINNDAVVTPGAISALSESLDSIGSSAIAFPALLHTGRRLDRVYYNRWLSLITSRRLLGSYEVPRGCCMLLARSRLPDGPLMDERFFMYGEELQLGWKLAQARIGIAYVDAALVVHAGSAAAVNGSAFYEERTALGHMLMQAEFGEGLIHVPRRLVGRMALLTRALVRAIRARSLLPIRAYRVAQRAAARKAVDMSSPGIPKSEQC